MNPRVNARATRVLLTVNLAATLITAWNSETFFHPDEHYQIVEFVGLKLGFTQPGELPWEFGARVRPFMQPALYYALLSPLVSLGLQDRFVMLFLLRLCSGLVAFGALVALLESSASWVRDPAADRDRIRWLTLAGFIPYLAVRTSSENLSGACLVFALAVIARGRSAERAWGEAARLPWRAALGAGLLLGLGFQLRFQLAFAIAGVLAWLVFVARDRRSIAGIALGGALTTALGVVIDRWGYGEWVVAPWNYLRVNIFEGKAATFGTEPFFAYLYITAANIFAPVVILVTVGLILCWFRRPKHLLTWTTVPFVLLHSAVGHKEERFLFPIALLALAAAAMGFEAVAPRWRRIQQTLVYRFFAGANLAGLLLLALYPLGWRPHHAFARWAADLPEPIHFAYADAELLPRYPFLEPRPWHLHVLGVGEGPGTIDTAGAPLYWLRREPFTAVPVGAGVSPGLAYTEFPLAGVPLLRSRLWPGLSALRGRLVEGGVPEKRLTWISAYPVAEKEPLRAGLRGPRIVRSDAVAPPRRSLPIESARAVHRPRGAVRRGAARDAAL